MDLAGNVLVGHVAGFWGQGPDRLCVGKGWSRVKGMSCHKYEFEMEVKPAQLRLAMWQMTKKCLGWVKFGGYRKCIYGLGIWGCRR